MKTEKQIRDKLEVLNLRLADALEHNHGNWDASDLQTAIQELDWVLS